MQTLISQLNRLYLPEGGVPPEALARQITGQATCAFPLAGKDGQLRAIVLPFDRKDGSDDDRHWTRLCTVANALQTELGLPAPAVSISGANGYRLWLSLEVPVQAATAQEFVRMLREAYFPEIEMSFDLGGAPVELPPCIHQGTALWAAFIHPGMGASFAAEAGLDMAPPLSGQVAFLEGLQSISAKQFMHALALLRQAHGNASTDAVPELKADATYDRLLLKDATLEDIVKHLHSKNIEPTFRHLIPESPRQK